MEKSRISRTCIVILFVTILLTGCATQSHTIRNETDMNHPITDTMGCPEDQKPCIPVKDNNAQTFGYYDASAVISSRENLGYLVRPAQEGNYPGVIMIHEWWGLNENIREMARQLASRGYIVYAVDLYDGNVATDAKVARTLVTDVSMHQEKATQKMREAATFLKEEYDVTSLASMGWCFGGGQSLQLALSGERLNATVIYYGSLVTDQEALRVIDWPVLGIFGEKDTSIPAATVEAFRLALQNKNISHDIRIYGGVGHAFANPSGPNFSEEQTKDAWDKTLRFLEENLKNENAR